MIITDSAKLAFENELKNQSKDSISLFLEEIDGETHLRLNVVNKTAEDRVVDVNGLSVILEEEVEAQLTDIIFDVQGENLVMKMNSSCGCGDSGCGCHEDGEEEGCGCGDSGCGC